MNGIDAERSNQEDQTAILNEVSEDTLVSENLPDTVTSSAPQDNKEVEKNCPTAIVVTHTFYELLNASVLKP